jgi:tetratricopeptide (TPR) repeat protein
MGGEREERGATTAAVGETKEEEALDQLLARLARPASEAPPPSVAHYRVVAKLGEGGMGAVYRAEDTRLGRQVALKRLVRPAAADADAHRRLLREARLVSGLSHPGLVTVHTIEEIDGITYIVMELVDGEPLDAALTRGPLPLERVLALGVDVAEALACAHGAGLVHRDIKPANLMLTPRGSAKVLDFGIARPVAAVGDGLTAPGSLIGTVPYMAPEQLRGAGVDHRADLWALGCVLYEAATGRRAFPGSDFVDLVQRIGTVDPPAPSALVPSLPPAFDALVLRALAKAPAARWESGGALAAALRELPRGPVAPAAARPPRLLVGRARELADLQGRSGTVVLSGDAGSGKSALVEALVERAGVAVAGRGRCLEQFGPGEAYLPLFDLFDDLLGGPHAARVRATLCASAPSWADALQLAERTGQKDVLAREAMGATRERRVRELGDALLALVARAPLLLVLEDVQWADPSTLDAIGHLQQRLARHPALLVVTVRSGELEAGVRAALASWRAAEVHLGPLDQAAIAAWLDARFGPNDFTPALAGGLHARTEGHALFVAGMLDALVESGQLVRDDAGWHARGDGAPPPGIPASLRGLLDARLGRLAGPDRQLLETAAVQGAEFVSVVAADALGLDDLVVDEALARLARGGELCQALGESDLPDGTLATRWRFGHALYRDALYAELPAKRRALLHLRAAESLLARHGDDAARLAAALAFHFTEGREPARAAEQLLQAAQNAMRLGDGTLADAHTDGALAAVARLPAGATRERARIGALRQRALVLTALGRSDEAEAALSEALGAARGLADDALVGAVHVGLADVLLAAHRVDEAAPHLDAALAASAGHPELHAEALAMRALERLILGDLEACRQALDAVGDAGPLVLHLRGLLGYFRSDYAAAERAFTRAIADNERTLSDGLLLMESRMFAALALANQGRLGQALARLSSTLALAQRHGSQSMVARVENSLGWVRRELGMLDEARAHDERAIEAGRASQESEAEANALINLSEDRLAAGELASAAAPFARVLELGAGDRWLEWRYGLRLALARARERLAAGAVAEAAAALAEVRARAAEQGATKYLAQAHELSARLALAEERPADALAALESARAALTGAPCPLVAWRVEALGADACARAGDGPGAARARARAAAGVDAIAADLGDRERAAFLGSAAVRALRG